jgi:hypothetical protein
MADRVATIDEVIGGLQAGSSKGKQVRADDGEDRLRRLRAYSR